VVRHHEAAPGPERRRRPGVRYPPRRRKRASPAPVGVRYPPRRRRRASPAPVGVRYPPNRRRRASPAAAGLRYPPNRPKRASPRGGRRALSTKTAQTSHVSAERIRDWRPGLVPWFGQ
jgi:hypothetical protein